MSSKATLINHQRRRIAGDVMTAYVNWREACLRVDEAYLTWQTATRAEVDCAFPAYTSALDREQLACEIYAGLIADAGSQPLGR